MTSTPPDPGHAIDAAKKYSYDADAKAFATDDGPRFLYPENDRWILTAQRERMISPETYAILRAATYETRVGFASGGKGYVLADDGVYASAIPA